MTSIYISKRVAGATYTIKWKRVLLKHDIQCQGHKLQHNIDDVTNEQQCTTHRVSV